MKKCEKKRVIIIRLFDRMTVTEIVQGIVCNRVLYLSTSKLSENYFMSRCGDDPTHVTC